MTAEERTVLRRLVDRARRDQLRLAKAELAGWREEMQRRSEARGSRRDARSVKERARVSGLPLGLAALVSFSSPSSRLRCVWCGERVYTKRRVCREHRDLEESYGTLRPAGLALEQEGGR